VKQVTTYVGFDAHKKDLFVAMLVGTQAPTGELDGPERAAGGPASGEESRARSTGARARLP
jgi:hypothetical protein